MKRLLGLLQILCLLHLLGGNAYANTASGHSDPFQTVHHAAQHTPVEKIFPNSSRPRKIVGLIMENIEEEEDYEQFSCKKYLEAGFTTVFYSRLPEYRYHDSKNHLAFRKQSSFIHPNSRQIVFQVFRI
jgi:hypothetical protein